MTTLTLVRGIPGSGKSTYVKKLNILASQHIEADMFFIDHNTGKYEFDREKLRAAHDWCKEHVRLGLESGKDMWCSNTFTTISELRPYFQIAKECGAELVVLTMNGSFESIHDVPEETLKRMRDRFTNDLTPLWKEFESDTHHVKAAALESALDKAIETAGQAELARALCYRTL